MNEKIEEIKEHAKRGNDPLFIYDGIEHQHTMKCLKSAIAEIERLEKGCEVLDANGASMIKLMRERIQKKETQITQLQRVCDCAKELSKAIDKTNSQPKLPNTSIAIQESNRELAILLEEQ